MKLDYQDIAGLIAHLIELAKQEGTSISSIEDLYNYLEENADERFEIISREEYVGFKPGLVPNPQDLTSICLKCGVDLSNCICEEKEKTGSEKE